jgi:hypothetical protein
MKNRLFIMCMLVLGAALLLAWAAAAQAPHTGDTSQTVFQAPVGEAIEPPADHILALSEGSAIGLTTVFTSFLPIALRNFGAPGPSADVPTLISPANGSTLDTISPMFKWDNGNSPTATGLWVEIWEDPALTQWAFGLEDTYTPGVVGWRPSVNLEPGTTYYWRAFFTYDGSDGPPSQVWSFTTGSGGTLLPGPDLLSPANGSTLAGTTTTAQWSPVDGAVEYLAHFKSATRHSTRQRTETQVTITGLSPNTAYEWWVQARNDYGWGNESAHWSFTTGAAAASLGKDAAAEREGAIVLFEDYESR